MTVLPYEDYGFVWNRPDAPSQLYCTGSAERAQHGRFVAALLIFCWRLTSEAAWRAIGGRRLPVTTRRTA